MLRSVIEIGTNSLKFLAGSIDNHGMLSVAAHRLASTRLGEGLAGSGKFSLQAMERTITAVSRFKEDSASLGDPFPSVIATHGLRSAVNAGEFADLLKIRTGLNVTVLSGRQEALYAVSGAVRGLGIQPERVLHIDMGGGSTEINFNGSAESFPVGMLSVAEKFIREDPVGEVSMDRMRSYINGIFGSFFSAIAIPDDCRVIFTGGTAVALGHVILRLDVFSPGPVHGLEIKAEALKESVCTFAKMDLAQRKKIMAFDPARADVILAGLVMAEVLLSLTGKKSFIVSVCCLSHGYLLHILKEHGSQEGFSSGNM